MKTRLGRLIVGTLATVALAVAQDAAAQTVADVSTRLQPKDTKWVVDMVHSQVDFAVRHLVGRVRGTFTKWYATLTTRLEAGHRGRRGSDRQPQHRKHVPR